VTVITVRVRVITVIVISVAFRAHVMHAIEDYPFFFILIITNITAVNKVDLLKEIVVVL
jgi:hypothetical protein